MALSPTHCSACHRPLAAGDAFFALKATVQGEQVPGGEGAEGEADPATLLAQMEAEGDWERYAAEVHWEIDGALCPPCSRRVKMLLRHFGVEPGAEE